MDKYDFLEHVFDATQLASEKVLGTPAIAIVRADSNTGEIKTVVFDDEDNKKDNYHLAIEWITDDGIPVYIIGGDIGESDGD